MPDVDLDRAPAPSEELRVYRGDCVVSIWLPASLSAVSAVLSALGRAGFELVPDASDPKAWTMYLAERESDA